MSDQTSSPTKALGVRFTPEDFNALSYHARRHQLPIREFIEHMARSYVTAMQQQEERVQASKKRGDQ